jgi:MYXO-CTERM domain-containing protein
LTGLWALVLTTLALPQGYLVWVKGVADDPASRKIFRVTLPERSDERALTAGEDVEPQVSPDGRWVAYAKAKLPGGSDYHDPGLWKVFLVSIHGAGEGRREIKIDDEGAWPSWGSGGALFYNQADGTHTRLVRVEIDGRGQVTRRQTVVSTRQPLAGFTEVNELAISGDERWFAGRTRGNATQNGVFAFTLDPLAGVPLARAGDVGCMPRVARDGRFGLIAGAQSGIRWGHGPAVPGRQEDQLLIPIRSGQHLAYHPGVSSDGRWVLASQGTEPDHNSGRYDLEIRSLDPQTMAVGDAEILTSGGFNGWPDVWVGTPGVPPPPVPEILELAASSYTLAPGEASTLGWSTAGADQVTLDGEPVPAAGNREVRPAATTRYELRAGRSPGDAADTRSVTVTVNATPVAVTVARFTVDPPRLEQGRSARLSWQVANATTLDIDGAPVAPEGEREVTPRESSTFVLTARGHGGPVEARAAVTVEARSSGLLPDRGGFRCSFDPDGRPGSAGAPPAWLLALVALFLRTARRRSPVRTTRSPRHPPTAPQSPPA